MGVRVQVMNGVWASWVDMNKDKGHVRDECWWPQRGKWGWGYEGGAEGAGKLKLGEEGALPWAYRVLNTCR